MIFKHIFGVIHFKASGNDTIKFVNSIRKEGILFTKFNSSSDEIQGEIYGKDLIKIKELADIYHLNIEIIKKKGLRYIFSPYKKRYGIIAGLILSIGIIFYLSNIVLKINVTGCDDELYKQVIYKLDECGIRAGKFIPSLDFDSIETSLVLDLNNVSWASIRSKGGIISVNIHESTPKPYIIPRHDPCNLIATRNAKIISVEVATGQLMKIIGDGVKSGEVLVSGILNDANNKPLYCHSIGKIIGEYTETFAISQPLTEQVKIESKKTKTKKSFDFFSIKIPLYLKKGINGNYTYKENSNNFSFFSLKLPFGMTTYSYSPYKYKTVTFTEDEAKSQVYNKLKIYEDNFLKGKTVIDKEIVESFENNEYKLEIKYVLQSDITKESEIFIKN